MADLHIVEIGLGLGIFAVELVDVAFDLDGTDLLAVGLGHVEVVRVVLLAADGFDADATAAGGIDLCDEFVVVAHALGIDEASDGT